MTLANQQRHGFFLGQERHLTSHITAKKLSSTTSDIGCQKNQHNDYSTTQMLP
jgi:hypothetical protein